MKRFYFILTFFWCVSLQAMTAEEGDQTLITVTGSITNAPACRINNNDRIDVDFGDDIEISLIDGVSYKKTPLIYDLQCQDLSSVALTMTITGTDAPFGSGLIGTDKTALGIRLLNGSTPVDNGEIIPFTYDGSGSTHPDLWAVLTADSQKTLTSGGFTSSAILVIDYQ